MDTCVPGRWRCKFLLAKQLDNRNHSWTHSLGGMKGSLPKPDSLSQALVYPGLSSPRIPHQTHTSSQSEPLLLLKRCFLTSTCCSFCLKQLALPSPFALDKCYSDLSTQCRCKLLHKATILSPLSWARNLFYAPSTLWLSAVTTVQGSLCVCVPIYPQISRTGPRQI